VSTFQLIPIEKILVMEGFNPRTTFDADAMADMVTSVKAHGILTPITVRPSGDDSFLLVFGHRRLKAAQDAKLADVPCMVLNGEVADPATQALIENVIRANLHPVDEGRALARIRDEHKLKTIAAIARRVGMSSDRVKRTIRYAALDDRVNQAFLDGRLPLYATDAVCELNKLGPLACAAIVGHAIENDAAHSEDGHRSWEPNDVDELVSDPGYYLTSNLEHLERSDEWTVLPVAEGFLAVERVPELDQLAEQARGLYNWPWQLNDQVRLMQEDLDAALAYGCLVQLQRDEGVSDAYFITDRPWFVDRVRPKLEQAIALGIEKRDNLAKMEAASVATSEGTTAEPPVTPEAKIEAERAKRKAEKEAREALDRSNREFGANLQMKLAKRKPTADDLKVLAGLLMYPEGTDNLWKMGWVRVNDELYREEKTDTGRTRLVELSSNEARKTLYDWVCRPSSPEEVHGRLFQVLSAAAFADHDAVVPSRRYANLRAFLPHLLKVARPALPAALLTDAQKRVDYVLGITKPKRVRKQKAPKTEEAPSATEGGEGLTADDAPPEAVAEAPTAE
jgi:ParB/RepB/Spo0J family partition protein